MSEQPLIAHLTELRNRLVKVVIFVLLIFVAAVSFANDIYHLIALPLIQSLPESTTMIATGVATPFLTPFKLTMVLSIFAAMPYALYHIWSFIAPALYQHEKRLIAPLLFSSSFLFYAGIAFAYWVVFPLAFPFFVGSAPEGVTVSTDINSYLDFVLKLFFAFGLAFQIPIATILLVWAGVTTPQQLAEKRRFVIVGVFVAGMLLTPPDVISQTLLALPMWLLYEIGLLASRFYQKRDTDEEDDEAEEDDNTEVENK
ncbi:twin-arginine translocase subunit TatC [Catenovulum maritimum]|uniref:Sec-independent protein translocase protein TatC n=1 Tax=Catenovulum maritimum TaxID=1513271 RepID=A0A0J8GPD4_9ALTE|nr:twin-arginine translocase subunit TatC [Catenovulum maritimum]KMT64660.1 twin-arginine protein translocation system subunit TatC [Catenovulum maritimum]